MRASKKKKKVPKFDRLGTPIGHEPKKVEFVNYANELKDTTAMMFGRSCGRVDFVFTAFVGRMLADDAEKLGNALIEAAKEARARAEELHEDAMERDAAGAR